MRKYRKVAGFSNEKGMSGLGMVATMAVIVAVGVVALRLAPHYIDFQTLRAVMDDLPGPQTHAMDKSAIIQSLEKRFKINNLRSFGVRDVVKIDRNKSNTTIDISYEIREPLVGNIEVVLVFSEQYSYP